MNWSETNNYLKGIVNTLDNLKDPVRVAAFDLDDTIIHRPKKGKVADSKWKILDHSIIDKIADLVERNYIIVIFSNQGGMGLSKNFDKLKWRKAVDDLVKILVKNVKNKKYYFAVYVSKNYDLYRKPNIGLWEQMKNDLMDEFGLNSIRISKKSFFVGDAAGRTKPGPFKKKIYPTTNKGDFSDSDLKFALNIKIPFMTPEDFFLKDSPKVPFKLGGIDPAAVIENITDEEYEFIPRHKEMVVLVGPPGSGKTEFAKKYIVPHGYVHINQDTCRTKKKCLDLTQKALEEKKSVVVDNTNPDVLSRMAYTSLAQDHGYKHIRAIIMNTDVEMAEHLNNVRHVYSNGTIPKISQMVYNIFKKNYVKPQETEHFDKIEKIDFIFNKENLDDPLWKKIFLRWS